MALQNPGPVICVFCGSSPGTSPTHLQAARELAHEFHRNSVSLVYGGGTVGLMGELARTLVSLSGPGAVHGVIPGALIRVEAKYTAENASDVTKAIDATIFGRTTVVPDMHRRKKLMAESVMKGGPGSGFVALSGGYGTMEELMEVTTWSQLGIHDKGVVVYNVDGYWDGLLKWVKDAVCAGFVSEGNSHILVEARTAREVLEALKSYRLPEARYKLHWGTT